MIEINKIYNENCLDTMKRMPDNFIDLTVTSPPYDNLRKYNGFDFDFEKTALELYRITKDGGVVVWIVGDQVINGSETGTVFRQVLYFKEVGFNIHDTMIWQKDSPSFPEKTRYSQIFEYMFVFCKGKPKTFNPIKDRKNKEYIDKPSNYKKYIKGSFRLPTGQIKEHSSNNKNNLLLEYGNRFNIWNISVGHQKSTLDKIAFEHPAIFPEKLANDHIISWSNEGDLVYDPFMGSGTTAKMSIMNKRNYIGSEISKEYCDIIKKRLSSVSETLF